MNKFWEKTASGILCLVAGLGVVGTAVFASKGALKAVYILEKAEKEKGAKLTKLEAVKHAATAYIPAALAGVGTTACIFGIAFINKSQQKAIASAYIFADRAYKSYINKIKGNNNIKDIDSLNTVINTNEGECIFYEKFSASTFARTKIQVMTAEYELNRLFILRGWANLNDFYRLLGLEQTAYGEKVGWSINVCDEYGYQWVDFEHKLNTLEDGLEIWDINMPFTPTSDYLD